MKYWLLFSVFLLLVGSCTIQKRTVNRGYFVQWHFKLKSKTTQQEAERYDQVNNKEIVTVETVSVDSSIQFNSEELSYADETTQTDSKDFPSSNSDNLSQEEDTTPDIKMGSQSKTQESLNPKESIDRVNIFVILGLIFLLLVCVFVILTLYYEQFILVFIIASVLAFVFSIIGLVQTKKRNQKGIILAKTGFVFGILVFSFALLISIIGYLYVKGII